MGQQLADRRDIDFVMHEQLRYEALTEHPRYSHYNRQTFDMIVAEARRFALKEILPTYVQGDREGVRFENGAVIVPECYRRPYALLQQGEWCAVTEDPEVGGQGLPCSVAIAVNEYITGTNFAFSSYALMSHGAGKMIQLFGSDELKRTYLKKLYTGQWSGTMLLTESNAGSDVGALSTAAVKNADGSYSLTGSKIFITGGDHDLAENIVHPVLARIEGAPAGTKGISIFVVPKYLVNADGTPGERNDIVCTGVEEKMGIHGSATCAMALGSKGACRGWLLGEENQGMKIMFHMMNEARLGVGLQAFAHASAAYLYALDYARQRRQGRDLEQLMNPEAPQVPIISHPDVRRMLLGMKAYVEGMRSFTYYVAWCLDQAELTEDPEAAAAWADRAALLTPVLKSYNANRGFDVCVDAIQVFGGAGYTKDYPVEQVARDCKIASIYEGTDGIQAMDLLGRKMGMKQGAVFMALMQTIQDQTAAARDAGLAGLADALDAALQRLGETALQLGQAAMSPAFKTAFAHSLPFLEVVGDCIMAWMLIWRATIASAKLSAGAGKKDRHFYNGQVKSAEFFIQNLLPVTMGKLAAIQAVGSAAVDIEDEAFGG